MLFLHLFAQVTLKGGPKIGIDMYHAVVCDQEVVIFYGR
jgi:hypothetical protein